MLAKTLFFLSGASLLAAQSPPPDKVEFNRDIRPILSDRCFYCHGPDAKHREGKLRLDLREEALAREAFVPGDSAKSELVSRIFTTDKDDLMPPPESHKVLSDPERELLKRWIDQGAVYQKHWAYEAPVKAAVPSGKNGIDFLVEQKLAEKGLTASPRADRRTLARRVYFDLIGLPPTAEEVEAFGKDQDPDAYGKLVDRLMANPHFGENMAIGWLDVVRFADTIGYHSDVPRNIYPYRDYVIAAFNNNKRFDQFTREQIAGDLLPGANQETRIGSAFNKLVLSTEEGGAQAKDYEVRMMTDRVRAIGAAWLGQTTGCAQCHDHKFDPIHARDFYSLGAFFADISENAIGGRGPGMTVLDDATSKELERLRAEEKAKKTALDALPPEPKAALETPGAELAAATKAREEYEKQLPHCLVSEHTDNKRTVRILARGNWMDETGEIVKAALPHYLPQPKIEGREPNRLDLAEWLVSRENPLTARTVMNRFWQQFFSIGLSRVLDDLGAQGEPPVNAPLLDWLACEFMDSGWDMKHMIRLMVTSEAYQRASLSTPQLDEADTYNRLTARQSPFRLPAELVRDNALKVSGLLVDTIGGPSVFPYQPDKYWENLNFPVRDYPVDSGPKQHRRGLYTWWQRSFVHPSLLAFDAATREECVAERNRSNIPQQALVLLNDPTYVEAARVLAERACAGCAEGGAARLAWMWQRVLQRDPRPEESATVLRLVEEQKALLQQNPAGAAELLKTGQTPPDPKLDPVETAAWFHAARVLLNLHETITRS